MSKDVYESPLASRYASPYLLRLFSPDMRYQTWRRLWVALARAEHDLGLPVTAEQVAELEAHLTDIDFDLAAAREKEVRHDVMAHVYAYGLAAPSAAGLRTGLGPHGQLRSCHEWTDRAGPQRGQDLTLTGAQYCAEIDAASQRLRRITGKEPLPMFRAPGGKTSPRLLQVAQSCGYQHVGWTPAGFLGDELPSDRYSNARLLNEALHSIGDGDVLLAHLGIWSRKDPWAPAVLEPLIKGLKERGLCFRTLREHPRFQLGLKSNDAARNTSGRR